MSRFLATVIKECNYNIHCDRIYPCLDLLVAVIAHHNHDKSIWTFLGKEFFTLDPTTDHLVAKSNERLKIFYFTKYTHEGDKNTIFHPENWDFVMKQINDGYMIGNLNDNEELKKFKLKLPEKDRPLGLYFYLTSILWPTPTRNIKSYFPVEILKEMLNK